MKKTLLKLLLLTLITSNLNANLSGKIIAGKAIEGIGVVCEGFDIYDTSEFVTQKVISYTNIRFGYRRMKVEKIKFLKNIKTGKVKSIKYMAVIDIPYIVLYNREKAKYYWVDLHKNKAYGQGDNIMMPFRTIGWEKLSQKDANKFFTAEVMNALHSAYSI